MSNEFNKELIEAIINVKKNLPDIRKTKTGQDGNRKFKYADLSDTLNAITPVLCENGLAIFQPVSITETGTTIIETILVHKNGSSFSRQIPVPIHGLKPKEVGSVITYFRRYAINSFLGINADEDNEIEQLDDDHPAVNIKASVIPKPAAVVLPKQNISTSSLPDFPNFPDRS